VAEVAALERKAKRDRQKRTRGHRRGDDLMLVDPTCPTCTA
jgi:hypothetical protein